MSFRVYLKTRTISIWNHQERNFRKNSVFKTRTTIRKYSEHLARFFLHHVVCAVKPFPLETAVTADRELQNDGTLKYFCFLKFYILSIHECWHSDTRHSYTQLAFLSRIPSTCARKPGKHWWTVDTWSLLIYSCHHIRYWAIMPFFFPKWVYFVEW